MIFASHDLEVLNTTLCVKNSLLKRPDAIKTAEPIPSVEISCSALIAATYNGLNPLLSNIDERSNGYIFAMETRRLKEYCKKTAWNNMPLTIPAVTKIKVHRIPEELKHKQKQRFYGRTLLTTEQWHREIRSFYTGTWYGSPFTSKPWWRAPMSKSSAPGSGTLTNEDGVTVADLTRFIKKKWKGDKAQKYYFAFMSVQ